MNDRLKAEVNTCPRESKSKTDERIAKLTKAADILYGKTTPEHGIYWKGDTDNSSSVEKDNDVEKVKTDTSSKFSDNDDEEDILDLMYPSMRGIQSKFKTENLKSKNKTSSLRDESKSQTSSDPAKVSDNDEEDDILDLMYPSMRGMKSKNDNEPTSEIKDEIEKATSLNLPKFAPEKEETRKTTAKNEKTEFDSGMKIPDFAENFDEDFDTDETEDEPGNKIEEQENDFSSEISNKKKKSDKDGILTGGAAEISQKTKDKQKINSNRLTDNIETTKSDEKPETTSKQEISKVHKNKSFEYGYKEKIVDNIHNPVVKQQVVKKYGIEAAEMLHMSKKDSYLNTEFARKNQILENYTKLDKNLQIYFKPRLIKSVGNENIKSIKGIKFDEKSETSQKIAKVLMQNKDFTDYIIKNKTALSNGKHISHSIKFNDKNFAYCIGKCDLHNIHINKNGDIELVLTDIYDFPENSNNILNQIGKERQDDGRIKPYFEVFNITIPKNLKIN